jgi:branched-chain amino acid transport system substrate-binding protein
VFVSGQTGVLATPAKAVARGIQAFVDDANENGGIDGRQIELEVLDNQSDPTRGVTLIQEQITGNDKPDLVIPGISSNEALAAAPILSRAEVLTIQAAASTLLDDVEKYPYFFSTVLTHEVIYESMVDFIEETDAQASKIALIAPEDAIGDATQQFFDGAFGDSGFATTEHRFKGDAVDISPVFAAAMAEDPDWIVMEGAGAQVATLVASRLKAGAESVPTIVGSSASSQPILDISTEAQRENLYNTLAPGEAWVEPKDRSEEFAKFVDAVKAQGELESPLSVYEAGRDAMYIWSRGVDAVDGEITGSSVKDALENLGDYEDPQVPAYGGGGGYSAESHFHPGKAEDFTFGRIIEKRDGMSVLQE